MFFFGGLCVTRCKKTTFVLTISRKLKIEKQIKAFDLLANLWSERRDLNSGPPVPQTGALTGLRYAPNGRDYSGWGEAAQPIADWPARSHGRSADTVRAGARIAVRRMLITAAGRRALGCCRS